MVIGCSKKVVSSLLLHGSTPGFPVPFKLAYLRQSLDFLLRQVHLVLGYRETLLIPRSLVPRRHLQYAVRIYPEGHVHFLLARRSWHDIFNVEFAHLVVVFCEVCLALENPDADRRLVVLLRVVLFGLFDGYRGISGDDRAHLLDSILIGLDAERERCHVQQKDVLDLGRVLA